MQEMEFAEEHGDRHFIYRVYNVYNGPQLRIFRDIHGLWSRGVVKLQILA